MRLMPVRTPREVPPLSAPPATPPPDTRSAAQSA